MPALSNATNELKLAQANLKVEEAKAELNRIKRTKASVFAFFYSSLTKARWEVEEAKAKLGVEEAEAELKKAEDEVELIRKKKAQKDAEEAAIQLRQQEQEKQEAEEERIKEEEYEEYEEKKWDELSSIQKMYS